VVNINIILALRTELFACTVLKERVIYRQSSDWVLKVSGIYTAPVYCVYIVKSQEVSRRKTSAFTLLRQPRGWSIHSNSTNMFILKSFLFELVSFLCENPENKI